MKKILIVLALVFGGMSADAATIVRPAPTYSQGYNIWEIFSCIIV